MNPRKRRLQRNRRSVRQLIARGEVATPEDLARVNTRFVPEGTSIRIRSTNSVYIFYPKGMPLDTFTDALDAILSPGSLAARKGAELAAKKAGKPVEYTSAYPASMLRGLVTREGKVVAMDVDSKSSSSSSSIERMSYPLRKKGEKK